MLSNTYGECRYSAAGMVHYIEFAIYMFNKTYIKKGVKRIPEEISMMKYLPISFNEFYWELIKAETFEDIKEASTKLMKAVVKFANQMKDKVILKKEISEAVISGTYEEIYSNWKNKMYHAANKDDVYLSLMTAASCQQFYDEMYSKFNINRIDIMKNIKADSLTLAAEAFDDAMEEYKKNYDRVGAKIRNYKDMDEFEKNYIDNDINLSR